jgi:hypothetical protein
VANSAKCALTDDDELRIDYIATTDRPTPVHLTHHSYWNLHGGGPSTILDHELTVLAEAHTPTDDELIPDGRIVSVAGTALDFRSPQIIGKPDRRPPGDAGPRLRPQLCPVAVDRSEAGGPAARPVHGPAARGPDHGAGAAGLHREPADYGGGQERRDVSDVRRGLPGAAALPRFRAPVNGHVEVPICGHVKSPPLDGWITASSVAHLLLFALPSSGTSRRS